MPAKSSNEELSQQADFVFEGTVKKVKAAAMSGVPVTDQTVVVTIDHIIRAPEHLGDYQGRNITVQLSGRRKVKIGQEAVFFTNPTTWGEDVAVTSLRQESVKKASTKLRSAAMSEDPVQNGVNRDTKARFDSSDLVIFGRVTGVSLPSGTDAEEEGTLSEHNPLWRDAEIEVQELIKGNNPGKTITVRFPSSEDIKWNNSPKFHVGQEGYIMLHKQEIKAQGATARVAKRTQTYTALSPLDVQPPEKGESLKMFVGG